VKLTALTVYQAWPDSDLLPISRPTKREALTDWWHRSVRANGGSEDFGDHLFSYVVKVLIGERCKTVAEAKEVLRVRLLDLESVQASLEGLVKEELG